MESIKREDLNKIRNEVTAALKDLGVKLGLTFEAANISFDSTHANITVKASVEGAARLTFEKYAELFGMRKTDFAKSFIWKGRTFTIAGIRPIAKKHPIIATCDGKTFLLPSTFDWKRLIKE